VALSATDPSPLRAAGPGNRLERASKAKPVASPRLMGDVPTRIVATIAFVALFTRETVLDP